MRNWARSSPTCPARNYPRAIAGRRIEHRRCLVEAGLGKSKGEARRIVEQGGAYVNNRRIEGVGTQLGPADLASESVMVLRSGKKKYALLRFGS